MAYTFLDLARDVLKQADVPLTYQEMWDLGEELGLTERVKTSGKTPWQSLGSRLYVDVRDNRRSRFVTVGKRPARFWLKSRKGELDGTEAPPATTRPQGHTTARAQYQEKDLHPLLAYYCYAAPSFNRSRSIYTKTIDHRRSLKSGYNEWLHPDMVGFYMPLEDWESDVLDLNRLSDSNSLRLFSFELKLCLNQNNYREAFFQAVSNSSWAHEGYLVAGRIDEDDELMSELDRLASAHGIGIICINPASFDDATVVYPARVRTVLDWETMSRLCEQNADFHEFLANVRTDFAAKRIHESEYDPIMPDIEAHLARMLGD